MIKKNNERIKIWANYKIAPDIKKLFDQKFLILDNAGLSREIARTLQSLRDSGRLMVGWDRENHKSVHAVNGIGHYKKRKRIGVSIFDVALKQVEF